MSDVSQSEAFEALADCEACLVEASVVELIAQEDGRGRVLERRCRACLRTSKEGVLLHAGDVLRGEPARARAALERWAREEGDPDAVRFVAAHFSHPIDTVVEQLARGERVETSFDAIAWLFPGVGAAGGGGGGGAAVTPFDAHDTLESGPPSFAPPNPEITWPEVLRVRASLPPMEIPVTHESIPKHLQPLRVSARALASVMLADGVADAADRAFVDRALAAWGHPPIEAADLAVWRPHDLGWPHDPGAVLEAMCRLAYVDGQRDATEWRVVREFARSWGLSLDAVEALGAQLRKDNEKGLRRAWGQLKGLFVR
ncbi:MAG: hypothetical protein U0353_12600 [Sandaracinus sp.]